MGRLANKEYRDQKEGGISVPGLPVPAKYSRNYVSVPQPGLGGRTSPVYSAAVVGGGTVVNGMFFNRGSAGDYDAWEKLGNPGWNWNGPNGLLNYFKKVGTSIAVAALKLTLGFVRRWRLSLHLPQIWPSNIQYPATWLLTERMGLWDPVSRISNIQL